MWSGGGLTGREDWKLPMVIGGRESPRLTVARELPMVTGGRELPRDRGRKRDGCTEEGDKLLQAVKE